MQDFSSRAYSHNYTSATRVEAQKQCPYSQNTYSTSLAPWSRIRMLSVSSPSDVVTHRIGVATWRHPQALSGTLGTRSARVGYRPPFLSAGTLRQRTLPATSSPGRTRTTVARQCNKRPLPPPGKTHLDAETHVDNETLGVADREGHRVVGHHRAADVDVHFEVRPRPEVPACQLQRPRRYGW